MQKKISARRATSSLAWLMILLLAQMPLNNSAIADTTAAVSDAEHCGITDKTITIGSCLPLSGPLRPRGLAMSHAADAYFSYVNEHGGVNGRQVKLETCDDKFDAETAINCFNTCLKDKAFAGAFFIGSAVITKYVRMCDVNRLPMLGFNVGPPVLCERHATLFNLRPCYTEEIRRQINELWHHNIRKIGILYQSDALGAGVREAAIGALRERHVEPAGEASFARNNTEVDDAYRRVKQVNPQAVIVAGSTVQIRELIQNRKQDDWHVPYIIQAALDDPVLENGTAADGIIMTQVLPQLDSSNKALDLYKQALKKYYPDDHPHVHGFEAFLNAIVLVEALKRAGHDLSRTKFVGALESLHGFDLGLPASYAVTYNTANHIAWSDKVLYHCIVHNGKLVPITDEDWKAVNAAKK